MRFVFQCFLMCAIVLGAQAGQGQHKPKYFKQRTASMSFGIVIGPAAARQPVRLYRKPAAVRGCSMRQASSIAREFGIRYQTIQRGKRTMTVVGFKRGHRKQIRISRAADCHIVR
jgi:hypothetical protein